MGKVLCFGELLLKLAAPEYYRLFQKDVFDISFCGSEANVAVSLSNYGESVKYVTVLPKNIIGQAATRDLMKYGVDISGITYSEGRMGLFYLERGASQRHSKVIYDRKESVFALSEPGDYNWERLFEDVSWFHISGITPALSDSLTEICFSACVAAKNRGITVSCDLNYRSALWSPKVAQTAMQKIMPYVDVCVGNEEDAEIMLGIVMPKTKVHEAELNIRDYETAANQICDRYGCSIVAFSLRESFSASKNGWSGILYGSMNKTSFKAKHYNIQIVDRVGAGDAFAAGVIYGLKNKMEHGYTVDFAVAASCLNHSIINDFNIVSVDEVEKLVCMGSNGRIER